MLYRFCNPQPVGQRPFGSTPKSQASIEALFAESVGGSPLGFDELAALIKAAESQSFNVKKLIDNKALLDKFTLAFTYNTNTIEGSTMTVADTRAVLFEGKTVQGRTLVEQLEAKNHQATLWWLLDQVRLAHFEITPELICDLHVRMQSLSESTHSLMATDG